MIRDPVTEITITDSLRRLYGTGFFTIFYLNIAYKLMDETTTCYDRQCENANSYGNLTKFIKRGR